jgi:ribosomal protein S18 acetylase RimI-like enzyme
MDSEGASLSPVTSELAAGERERALAFVCANDREVAEEVIEITGGPIGWVVVDRARPTVWDANYLWVQRARATDAAALAAIADEVQGAAGLAHRYVLVADATAGEKLTPGFLELGWHALPYVVMVHRHARLLVGTTQAREVPAGAIARARRAILLGEPGTNVEVADQILGRDVLIDRVAAGRHFAATSEGALASSCQLWRRDGVAQVENVFTARRFRNRGLARAVVSLATEEGRRDAGLVFLLADGGDWPQHLYRRLGYETVGLLHRFCPTLPQALPRHGRDGE